MNRKLAVLVCLGALLACAARLFAQDTYQITPNKTTMLVGESRTFRMVDQYGRAQHKVTWTISDAGAFQSTEGDEIRLYSRQAGDFRLTARTDFATAEASVTVVEGTSLPPGSPQWVSGGMKGCVTTKVTQVRPVPNGPDIYQQARCEDGEYIAAYTSQGVQLWRRKLNDSGAPPSGPMGSSYEILGNRLDATSKSVCDSLSAGTEQQKVRDLLTERSLSFHEEGTGARVWLVEESNAQCRLWFDDKLLLVKKRKVFVTE